MAKKDDDGKVTFEEFIKQSFDVLTGYNGKLRFIGELPEQKRDKYSSLKKPNKKIDFRELEIDIDKPKKK